MDSEDIDEDGEEAVEEEHIVGILVEEEVDRGIHPGGHKQMTDATCLIRISI